MFIMDHKRIRDEKIDQLSKGISAYAESHELIRLIKRDIQKYQLFVHCDEAPSGCWFIPLHEKSGSAC